MTTKEYLGQMRNIDQLIKDKIEEAERWRSIAEKMTGNINEICVQTSKEPDKMANAVVRLVDLMEESDEQAVNLIELKHKVIQQIDGLHDLGYIKDYNILKSYYVQEKSLSLIARECYYSYKQMKRLYEKAILRFGEIYGDTYFEPEENVQKCPEMSTGVQKLDMVL